jgi:acetyl-CoA synthetase
MPMVPEAVYAMLACARIGAIHSVVFAGFSAEALRSRIMDAGCKMVMTADQGVRGGKITGLKLIVDQALQGTEVNKVMVFKRTGAVVPMIEGRDVDWDTLVNCQNEYCDPEQMDSEDPLFMLYTSGSTGKPKGLVHTQAGYILGATLSCKYVFDIHEGDIHGCMVILSLI